jgi:predicted PurR-regulated permease PerM
MERLARGRFNLESNIDETQEITGEEILVNDREETSEGEMHQGKSTGAVWDLRQYVITAVTVFITFCCCILFFFLIYRYNGFADSWNRIAYVLQPIIIGAVVAYLLNPVMRFVERQLVSLKISKKASRGIAIAASLVLLLGVIVLLIAAIVPAVISSIQSVASTISDGANNLVNWVTNFLQGDSELANEISDFIESTSDKLREFLQNDVLSQVQTYATSIASGAIYVGRFLLNIIIGLIVSIYLMASKEKFAGQAKKIVYAMFKPVRANVVIETARKSNEIFGGFISGKLLDSAIIGIISYVVLAIMRMPDTILVAVIIGVTNIIPFFGPFIGAIPSFIIIALQNPIQGLYFLIFVIVLQQVDGNIIGPKILGNSTGLSPFWVVFAILLFGGLWGFPGMVLGVPTMAVIYYIIKKVMEYFLRKRGLKEDTASYVELVKVDKDSNEMIYK